MAGVAMWSRRARGWLLALLVLSTALGDLANINFLSMETYRGPDRGFEVSLSDLVALALALSVVVTDFGRVRWFPPLTMSFLIFVTIGVASTLASPVPLLGVFTLVKLAKFYLVYWCVANLLRTGTPRRYLWLGFVGIAAVLTIVAVYQKYGLGIYRVHGTFDHSNTIPAFANLILPVLIVWALVDREVRPGEVVVSALAVCSLAFFMTSEVLLDRIDRTDITTEERVVVFENVRHGIAENPLLGFGYGTFADSFRLYDRIESPVHYDRAHNTWLENLFELGVPAAMALFFALGGLVLTCLKGVRRRERDWAYPALGVAASVLVGMHALLDFSLQIPAVAILYACIMGLSCAQSWSSRA